MTVVLPRLYYIDRPYTIRRVCNDQSSRLLLGVLLLVANNLFDTDGSLDRHNDRVLATVPSVTDFVGEALRVRGKVQVRLLGTAFVHEGKLIAFNVNELPFRLLNKGNRSSVGRGDHVFVLLSSENVGSNKVALGVAVLARLGDRDGENLAWVALDHHVSV